ncbi:MAG TPA: hypothetical protein VM581_00900, partial [Magnetospirillaceae bacterium]|nr:hypothetical protein [Magnetospirillaceae bacterium]
FFDMQVPTSTKIIFGLIGTLITLDVLALWLSYDHVISSIFSGTVEPSRFCTLPQIDALLGLLQPPSWLFLANVVALGIFTFRSSFLKKMRLYKQKEPVTWLYLKILTAAAVVALLFIISGMICN